MARRCVRDLARGRIDRDADRGRHVVVAHVTEHAAEDRLRRRVLEGVGAEGVAELAHERGGRDALARHVADRDLDDAVGPPQHVEPVAPDLQARAPGLVARRRVDGLDRRNVRQEAALQRDGDVVLLLVPQRPPHRALARCPGLGSRAREDPAEQREVEQRDPAEQRRLEEERAPRGREHRAARPIEDDRPLRDRGVREREHVPALAVQPVRVRDHALPGREALGRQEPGRAHEADDDRPLEAVDDRKAGEPEVERRLAAAVRRHLQRAA